MKDASSDDARRLEIARRAHLGLGEDLEDLRAELAEALPDFEKRLQQRSASIPDWLKLSPGHLRGLFHYSDESVGVDAIIGPRTVAVAAGRLEAFVERWFERIEEDPEGIDDEALVDDYVKLATFLESLDEAAHHRIARVERTLSEWRDEILIQLELRREHDVEAVEELMCEGEIPDRDRARQEIAHMWEEQRERASQLEACWGPLVELLDEGAVATGEGLDTIGEMFEQARQGLIGARDTLAESLDPIAIGPQVDAGPQSDQRSVDDETPDPAASTRLDTAAAVTAPNQLIEHDEAALDEASSSDTVLADTQVEPAGDTIPEEDFLHGIIPIEEPSSGSEEHSLETSSVTDYSEPERVTRPPTRESRPRSIRRHTVPDQTSGASQKAPPERESGRANPGDDRGQVVKHDGEGGDPSEAAPHQEAEGDPIVEGGCFCFKFELNRVGALELVGVLAAPVLVLGGMALLQLGHLAGLEGAFNPLERWSWAPAALTVAGAWLVLVPLVLSWRVRWEGFRPQVLRRSEVRKVAQITLREDALCLDQRCWPIGSLQHVRLRRWDLPGDGIFGWVLALEVPGGRRVELATAEENRHTWQNSPVELADLSYDAWQLDAQTFEAIRAALLD